MDDSCWQNNTRKEKCGKWLTTKSKSNRTSSIKQQRKQKTLLLTPCVTRIFKPLPFEPPVSSENKICRMKQTTVSQFFVEKTEIKSLKKRNSNSNDLKLLSTSTKCPVAHVLPMKRRISSTLSDDDTLEELWGSDSEEDKGCKTVNHVQKGTSEETARQKISENLHYVDASEKRNELRIKEKTDIEKLFFSPKRLKKAEDIITPDIGTRAINSSSSELQFTQWFENEVDALKKRTDQEDLLSSQFPSSRKLSDSEEESHNLKPQFSEWFTQQIQEVELQVNVAQSQSDISQHNSTFTQWFEERLNTFKSKF